jgi:hypothetical protein
MRVVSMRVFEMIISGGYVRRVSSDVTLAIVDA